MPNLIKFKVQLPIGNHPTSSGKCVLKYLIANAHLIGCIYTASVAPSGYIIISGLILTWLIMLTGVLHSRRSLPELDTLSFTVSSTRKPEVICYLLWPCWSLGKPVLLSTSVGKTFLAAAHRNSPFVFGRGLAGSESDCEDFLGWKVVSRCTLPCFPPRRANWHSSSRPAGGTVNQLQQRMLLSASFQRAGQWSPVWKNAAPLPELKHRLSFSLCRLDWTHNFSLQSQGSVPPPILFLYIYCPSLKGFIPKCSSVCSLVPQLHTHLWPNPCPPMASLATIQLHMDRICLVAESPSMGWSSAYTTTMARYSYLRPHAFLCFYKKMGLYLCPVPPTLL